MKVVNHHKNNYSYDRSGNGSVIRGTLYMSQKEFKEVIGYLAKEYKRALKNCDTSKRDGLSYLFDWILPKHDNKSPFCAGITATTLIFKHYNLPRYKEQNYTIKIV